MSKTGIGWINSPEKRAFEISAVGLAALPTSLVATAASLAIASTGESGSVINYAERSLYPGNEFVMRKLGNPESDNKILKICRKAMVDELPQTLDILRGTMSLIGPRADKPSHIINLFAAVEEEDKDLASRWLEVRSWQKPGIFSSYAIESHSRNLEARPEYVRYSSDEIIARNGLLRANLDIFDAESASLHHDVGLILLASRMALRNYGVYANRLRSRLMPQGH